MLPGFPGHPEFDVRTESCLNDRSRRPARMVHVAGSLVRGDGGMSGHARHRSRMVVRGLVLLLCLGLLFVVDFGTRRLSLDQLHREAKTSLRTRVAGLQRELDKYEALPEVVALDPRVRLLLVRPGDEQVVDTVNRHLENVSRVTGASDVYLMDARGLTLAASNWNRSKPFVGRNFSYRPYFQDSIEGRPGKYYALGTTSSKRGYYFSHPVSTQDGVAGVLAVKVSMADLESAWSVLHDELLVTDPNGVVFLASNPRWHYGTIEPLSDAALHRIEESRQYDDAEIAPLPLQVTRVLEDGARVVRMSEPSLQAEDRRSTEYLMESTPMPGRGWTVHILSATAAVHRRSLLALLISGLALSLVFLGVVYMLQRREHASERRRLQDEAHQALRQAHEKLEELVADRTRELVDTNVRLEREVDERLEAERVLRGTQDDLVQAGKLAALGQMAVEITHELNQPLTAVRGYADNAAALIERDRSEEAISNISAIGDLASRMANITRQLKTFARKSNGDAVEFPVHDMLDSVFALLEPRLRRGGIECSCDRPNPSIRVLGDCARLEQVLVNLCQNAIDAVASCEVKHIEVSTESTGDSVVIRVRDSGKGIDESALPKLFEPYFTTKDIGEGLGLGLSISYGIIKEHGGSIVAASHAEGGAEFVVTLPRARPAAEAVG